MDPAIYRGKKTETTQAHIVVDLHAGVALSIQLVCSLQLDR